MTAPRFTQAQLRRAIDGVRKAGLPVGGVEVRPDGTIRVLTTAVDSRPAAPDDAGAPEPWTDDD